MSVALKHQLELDLCADDPPSIHRKVDGVTPLVRRKNLKPASRRSSCRSAQQYSLPFGTIRLDKGLLLATAPSMANRRWIAHSSGADLLVQNLVERFRRASGMQRFHRNVYVQALKVVLANLFHAASNRKQLIITRSNDYRRGQPDNPLNIRPETLIRLTDWLSAESLITLVVGKSNEYQGNASWCTADPSLIEELERAEARVRFAEGTVLAVVRDSNKNAIEVRRRSHSLKLKNAAKSAQEYNDLWLNHYATLRGGIVLPFCYRIFNNSIGLGGRWYGSFQRKRQIIAPKIVAACSVFWSLFTGDQHGDFANDS